MNEWIIVWVAVGLWLMTTTFLFYVAIMHAKRM